MRYLLVSGLVSLGILRLAGQNVGIGTNTPDTRLHVHGGGGVSGGVRVTSTGANNPTINFYAGTATPDAGHISFGDNTGWKFHITRASDNLHMVTVQDNGRVGVGTTDPRRQLHVMGPDNPNLLRIESTGGGFGAAGIEFVSDNPTGTNEWRPGYILSGDNGNYTGRLDFYTNGTGAGSQWGNVYAMSVVNGRVGVGVTTPGYILDVANRMRVRQGDSPSAGIWFYQTGPAADRGFVGMQSDNAIGFWGSTGAGWGLVMNTSNGFVGIGTTVPAQRLHVAGTIRSDAIAGNHPGPQTYSLLGANTDGDIRRVNPVNGHLYTFVAACAFTVEGSVRSQITNGNLIINVHDEGGAFRQTCVNINGIANASVTFLVVNDDVGNCPNPARISRVFVFSISNNGGQTVVNTDLGCNGSDGNHMVFFIHYNPL